MIWTVVTLCWGLWVGGLIAVFLAVSSLFQTFSSDHATAGRAAISLFHRFDRYQLILSAVALLSALCARIASKDGRATALFFLFAMATLSECYVTIALAPRIERLRAEHLTESAEFVKLHGRSMIAYLCETAMLLIGVFFLPNEKAATPPPE